MVIFEALEIVTVIVMERSEEKNDYTTHDDCQNVMLTGGRAEPPKGGGTVATPCKKT